jgi:hypothetical protein
MNSWLEEYIHIMDTQVGQVWRIVRTKMDSSADKRMVLLIEEKRRATGKRWFWTVMDVETGAISAITPWEHGSDWKWERFA